MFRRLGAALCAAALALAPHSAIAQTSPSGAALISKSFQLSSTGYSPTMSLTGGQTQCTVTLEPSTSYTNISITPQVASDGPGSPVTWATATGFNGGAPITSNGAYTGNVALQGATNFRVYLSAISSGTVTGVEICSTAGPVFVGNASVNSYTPTPNGNPAQSTEAVTSYGQAYNASTSSWDSVRVDALHALEVTTAGTYTWRLTSSSATTCTSIAAGAGVLVSMYSVGPATSVYPQFYDEGASPTCATADLVFGDGTSVGLIGGAAGAPPFNTRLTHGLAYRLSGALSLPLIINTYGLGF